MTYKTKIKKIIEAIGQPETCRRLDLNARTVDNYRYGKQPGKRVAREINNLYWEIKMPKNEKERATELEYLQWFHAMADFGPADGDVRQYMDEQFVEETGKRLPEGYDGEE